MPRLVTANIIMEFVVWIVYLYKPYLLTYSMVQSPSWEANRLAASQAIPCISWNPRVHYRTHKRQPPVPILGQPNPVHIPTTHLLEIHPNIINPSMPRSPQWSLPPVSRPRPYTPPSPHPYAQHARMGEERGVVYLWIVLSPEQASQMQMFLNMYVLQGGVC